MKVVINTIYGGFGLSHQAMMRYGELKGLNIECRKTEGSILEHYYVGNEYFFEGEIERNDPALVQVVEELKDKANGSYASLKVVTIPDDIEWYVEEYDGAEHVAEVHRTWN